MSGRKGSWHCMDSPPSATQLALGYWGQAGPWISLKDSVSEEWREGSVVRMLYCSYRGLGFRSQLPHDGWLLSKTPGAGARTPFPDLQGLQHKWCTYTRLGTQNKMKYKFRKRILGLGTEAKARRLYIRNLQYSLHTVTPSFVFICMWYVCAPFECRSLEARRGCRTPGSWSYRWLCPIWHGC